MRSPEMFRPSTQNQPIVQTEREETNWEENNGDSIQKSRLGETEADLLPEFRNCLLLPIFGDIIYDVSSIAIETSSENM